MSEDADLDASPGDPSGRHARRFGHVRSLLHGAPSERAWLELCRVLARMDPQQLPELLEGYVLPQLRSWPDALRVCPQGAARQAWTFNPALHRLARVASAASAQESAALVEAPWASLDALTLVTSGEQLQALAQRASGRPWLPTLRALTLQARAPHLHGQPQAQALLSWGALALDGLRELTLDVPLFTPGQRQPELGQALAPLWRAPWMARLESLALVQPRMVCSAWIEALESEHLASLRALRVTLDGGCSAQLAQRLGRSPALARLRELDVTSWTHPQLVRALARSGARPERLALALANMEPDARALWASGCMEQLRQLQLRLTSMSAAAPLLAALTRAEQIEAIGLMSGELDQSPPGGLARRPALRSLALSSMIIPDVWLLWLSRALDLSQLESLTLAPRQRSSTPQTAQGVMAIMRQVGRGTLRRLALEGVGLDADQIIQIVRSGALERCEELVLSNHRLEVSWLEAMCEALLDAQALPALRRLSLAGSQLQPPHQGAAGALRLEALRLTLLKRGVRVSL